MKVFVKHIKRKSYHIYMSLIVQDNCKEIKSGSGKNAINLYVIESDH